MKKIITYILLFLIIALQLSILIYYMNKRTATHVDEIWSYGLANSYDFPTFWEIGKTKDNNNTFYNKWHDGNKWFKYITVQPNETFAFDKVYRIQSLDISPPLYYFLIHFICSCFPNTFSLWYGQIINIIAFIITQFFLFKLTSLLFKNLKYPFAIVCFFGFSMAAINTYIFIRMYALLTMFCVILSYIILKIIYTEKIQLWDGIGLFITGFLGFLTQHYFAFYFFSLSVGIILFFINKKSYKIVFKYILVAFTSFISYFAYFPYVFKQMHFQSNYLTTNGLFGLFPIKEILVSLSFIINYTLGIDLEIIISFFRKITLYLAYLCPYIKPIFIILGIILVFWFYIRKHLESKISIVWIQFLLTLFLTSCYTTLHMRLYFCRYYFALLPIVCILEFSILELLLRKITVNTIIKDFVLFTLLLIFILLSHTNSLLEYCCMNLPSREQMAELFKEASIISVQKYENEEHIQTKAQEFRFAKRVFPTREYEGNEIKKAVDSLSPNDKNYIIVPENEYGLLIVNMLKHIGVKPKYLFSDYHPNYDQIVFEIYANGANSINIDNKQ